MAATLAGALLLAPAVHAQSGAAYDSANCEAAFLQLCPNVETTVVSEAAAAAPLPAVGVALWELLVVVAGAGGVWLVKRRWTRRRGGDYDR